MSQGVIQQAPLEVTQLASSAPKPSLSLAALIQQILVEIHEAQAAQTQASEEINDQMPAINKNLTYCNARLERAEHSIPDLEDKLNHPDTTLAQYKEPRRDGR
ncbi:hypothetical protein NDU88_006149 [Pleurodeles waltl]|uniref:Uncharacterized protein n=1 Tax=Pleurodeles waltl TaxID=8319 RepID=A0AAV7TZA4_PLEWA|nr:hypothetical protein NDU88_006149 [Pleurodeles waltl]